MSTTVTVFVAGGLLVLWAVILIPAITRSAEARASSHGQDPAIVGARFGSPMFALAVRCGLVLGLFLLAWGVLRLLAG